MSSVDHKQQQAVDSKDRESIQWLLTGGRSIDQRTLDHKKRRDLDHFFLHFLERQKCPSEGFFSRRRGYLSLTLLRASQKVPTVVVVGAPRLPGHPPSILPPGARVPYKTITQAGTAWGWVGVSRTVLTSAKPARQPSARPPDNLVHDL